jgi:hypothetical protein
VRCGAGSFNSFGSVPTVEAMPEIIAARIHIEASVTLDPALRNCS